MNRKLMSYGVSYKGSKNMIVGDLMEVIPTKGVENFYDLFAGGCAVTHKAMIGGKFSRYFANDLDGQALRLFADGIHGKYRDEKRWISREDFARLKDSDPYVSCCWSFGNNQRNYLYSRTIEPYKKACHYAIVFGDFTLFRELCPEVADACEQALDGVTDTHERRIKFGPAIVNWLKAHGAPEMLEQNPLYSSCRTKRDTKTRPKDTIRDLQSLESLQSLERLQRLESLERLQRLESLESLQGLKRLQVSFVSYDEVEILPDSVIYCDPPYRGTDGYHVEFDHDKFYDWCGKQTELILVSEYAMPEDRFTVVWQRQHRSRLSGAANNGVTEKLFVPRHQAAKYQEMMTALALFPKGQGRRDKRDR